MKGPLVLIFLIFLGVSTYTQVPFQNIAAAVGIDTATGSNYTGYGISFADFNNDGYDDLTFATKAGDSILFYKNVGNGTFQKLPALVNHTGWSKQVLWVDIDNDLDLDFFVTTTEGANKLYENTAAGLVDITASSGIAAQNHVHTGAAFGDIDKDGDLDLFISVHDVNTNIMYRNNGDKTFTDITVSCGIGTTNSPDFCSVFFDFDNDNDLDLYTVVDKYDFPNKLYKNNGTGSFTDVSASTGAGISIDAMNAGVADYNNDGLFDIYVTNTNTNVQLYNNLGVFFVNFPAGTGVPNQENWGACFLDVDNDKFQDLYVASEHYSPSQHNWLFKNTADDFFEPYNANGGMPGDTLGSYACAMGDFNNDGRPDIAVNNGNNQKALLWENITTNSHKYAKVKLQGSSSNKMGIGSLITLYTGGSAQYRFTHCGINYLAQNSLWEHFGASTSNVIDSLIVKWPSGTINKHYNLGLNQRFNIQEGKCLDHEYTGTNTAANKYTGSNGNLLQASNWSAGHIPTTGEDVVFENSTPSPVALTLGSGQTINCRSITMAGNISITNLGTVNAIKSYGAAFTIGASSTFINEGIIFIDHPCGKALSLTGNFQEKGTMSISAN